MQIADKRQLQQLTRERNIQRAFIYYCTHAPNVYTGARAPGGDWGSPRRNANATAANTHNNNKNKSKNA